MLERLQEAIDRVQALSPYATYREKLTNTFGIVLECEAPRHTSGTDFIQTIKLADESHQQGVPLCIFASDVGNMPIAQMGDILELQHVVVQFWQDRPQLFAKLSKPHTFGFLLYRPAAGNNGSSSSQQALAAPVPVQVFNANPESPRTAERFHQLQAMLGNAVGQACATDSTSVYLRRIKDLAPPESTDQRPSCVDMRVQVLAVDKRASDEVVMYVWDATDARPVPGSLQMLPSVWKGVQLTTRRPRRHVMPLQSQPPAVHVLQDLPCIGTALPVVMQGEAVPSTGLPVVGAWVKIKIVGVVVVEGQWQVVFGQASRLAPAQPTAAFETWYQTRLANNDTCEWPLDPSKVATSCSISSSLPRSTVRQVLLATAQRQPGPFRVQLRLLGYLPSDLQHWCKTRPQQGEEDPVWEWAAHFWMEDATGELRLLLLGNEASNLLGICAQCLTRSPSALSQLKDRMHYLATVDDDGGIWIEAGVTPLYPASQEQQHPQQGQHDQAAAPSPPRMAQHDGHGDQGQLLLECHETQSHAAPPCTNQQPLQQQHHEQMSTLAAGHQLEHHGGVLPQPVFVLHHMAPSDLGHRHVEQCQVQQQQMPANDMQQAGEGSNQSL